MEDKKTNESLNGNKLNEDKLSSNHGEINQKLDDSANIKIENSKNDDAHISDKVNNEHSSLEDNMVSLEEASQSNEEFFSAKEFNFGIEESYMPIDKDNANDTEILKNDDESRSNDDEIKKNDESDKKQMNLNESIKDQALKEDLKTNESVSSIPIDSLDDKASNLRNNGSSDEFMSSSSVVSGSSSDEAIVNSERFDKHLTKDDAELNRDILNKNIYSDDQIDKDKLISNKNIIDLDIKNKINSHDQEQVNFEHFKDLDSLKETPSDELNQVPMVASITTSVIQVPCSERMYHTISETDRLSKNSLDSLENDSLNSESCISAESDTNDKINPVIRKKPQLAVNANDTSKTGFITNELDFKKSLANDAKRTNCIRMTCGKCDDTLSKQLEKSGNDKASYFKVNKSSTNNNEKTNGHQNDKYELKNGSYHTLDSSKSPRGSEQYDDGPYLTDISPEKRGSIFAKMSTLPLDDSDQPGAKDFKATCLLEEDNQNPHCRKILAQVLAVSAKNTLALNFGLSIGFQTIAIPYLSKPNDDLFLNKEEISLFGSLFFTVIPIGCLLSGPTIHGWGRKRAMLIFCIPLFIGWWLYYVAHSALVLYAAILLLGLVNGLLEAPILTYVAEVTEAKWRGVLASSSSVAALLGILIQLIFGNFLSWRTAAAVTSIFPILSFVVICFVPESPHWLASKGREKDVEKSLMWLRGWTDRSSVALEVEALMKAHKQPKVAGTPLSWKAYTSRTFIEPFLIVLGSFAIGHFSGMATVQTYAVQIFDELGVSGWSWAAGLGATQVMGALLCVVIIPFVGKRPISILSMAGVAIGMAAAATCSSSLAACGLLLANFCTNACSRVIPWVLVGEVFTNEMRAVASGLASCLAYALGFCMSYTYLQLETALTLRGLLGSYAIVGLIGSLIYYAYLPETEGKSLAEVQEYFAKKCNRRGIDNMAFEKDKP